MYHNSSRKYETISQLSDQFIFTQPKSVTDYNQAIRTFNNNYYYNVTSELYYSNFIIFQDFKGRHNEKSSVA